ncbi:glycoside hydrolase family 43 protein [Pedobacter ginsenosidimutans]|uniref:glycoside hydrolase family 43 protein n=1 Tax=Pedobacter ginsenosidimutans TaxID=687842 RepID=UPI001AE080D9|nr:glycoside hydrolase family 43 protein [Pedobacter ginsenosidimutans]
MRNTRTIHPYIGKGLVFPAVLMLFFLLNSPFYSSAYLSNTTFYKKVKVSAGLNTFIIQDTSSKLGAKGDKKIKFPKVHKEPKMEGYLFCYFEGSGARSQQEQLRFGISEDAVNWYALNGNKPILSLDQVALSGGIRDPHIMRKVDNKGFLMVATDMNTVKNGWSQNNGIVMSSSHNLLTWKHHAIDLSKTYPESFSKVKWVWAPQTIYDPSTGKYLVYFTIRFKDDQRLDFYCAYAKEDFSGFEDVPKLMFSAKFGAIDGDIIFKDGIYHFFYKGNTKDSLGKEVKNGIQQATSKSLSGPWTEDFKYLDVYSDKKVVVEGSSIFKLNNSGTYILMYDLYTNLRYEYQTSKDLYNFSKTAESFEKNFNPRHGAVMGISKKEMKMLKKKWPVSPSGLSTKTN